MVHNFLEFHFYLIFDLLCYKSFEFYFLLQSFLCHILLLFLAYLFSLDKIVLIYQHLD